MQSFIAVCVLAIAGMTLPLWADSTENRPDKQQPPPGGKIVVQTQPSVLFSRPFHTVGGCPVTVKGNRVPDEFGVVRPFRVPDDYVGDPVDLPTYFWERESGVVRPHGSDPGYVKGRLPLNRYIRQLQYRSVPIYEVRDEFGVIRPVQCVSVKDDKPTIEVLKGDSASQQQPVNTTYSGAVEMPEGVTTVYAAGKTLASAPEAIHDDAWALLNAGWYRDAARLFERGGAADAQSGRALAVLLLGRLGEAERLLTELQMPTKMMRLDAATAEKLRAMREFVSDKAAGVLDRLLADQ
jgi:hypothetical protein